MSRLQCIFGEVDVSVLWVATDRRIIQKDKTRMVRKGDAVSVSVKAMRSMRRLGVIEVREPGGALLFNKPIDVSIAVGNTVTITAPLVVTP